MSVHADGKPGGPRTAVQYNDAGAFAGDAGLTYSARELTITGDADKTTPLLAARSGDFRASGIAETFIANGDVLYTAVNVGTAGNSITVAYSVLGANQSLSVAVVGSAITVSPATDGGALVTSTANDVLAAVNADAVANLLVLATLAPGNDGTGLVSGGVLEQLSGGALAADTAWIDERGVLNVQLQTGIGENSINVRDANGLVVAHIDSDGGVAFSNERFLLSQSGTMSINVVESLPLSGNVTLQYAVNGFGLFTVAAGGGYGFSVNSPVAGDILFNVAAGTGQTGDLFVAFDENFAKTVRILANGDMQFDQDTLGPILIDRTTTTRYRLFVDSGVLGIEVA